MAICTKSLKNLLSFNLGILSLENNQEKIIRMCTNICMYDHFTITTNGERLGKI